MSQINITHLNHYSLGSILILSSRALSQAVSRRPITADQPVWSLWCTKWHRDGFFSEYFGLHLSVLFNLY